MPVVIGPDGFLCSRDDPHYAFHVRLNENLLEQAKPDKAASDIARAGVERFKKEFSKRQLVELVIASTQRLAWIGDHRNEIAQYVAWHQRISNILDHLFRAKLPFTTQDLCTLMQARNSHLGITDCVARHFIQNGLTQELCAELRRFRDDYKAVMGGDYGTGSFQIALQQLNILLWHDEWDELDLAACWSERVRQAYRAMSGDRRTRWRALLHHIRGDAGSKPPKPWLKEAEKRLAAVGLEDFRGTICDWFAPFRSTEPVRLSVSGSHVLKGLLWYGALARDAGVNEAALSMLDATWTPKRNLDKVMVALGLLIDTLAVEEAWQSLVRLQKRWGTCEGQIGKLLVKIGAGCGVSQEKLGELNLLHIFRNQERLAKLGALESLSRPQSAEVFLATVRVLRGERL
jgi:hypothetical protein